MDAIATFRAGNLRAVTCLDFVRTGDVLVDEAGEPFLEGADAPASAFIRRDVLAFEVAETHVQTMCFVEHVFPAGALGGNEIVPGLDPVAGAGDGLRDRLIGLTQGGLQTFDKAAAGELCPVAHRMGRTMVRHCRADDHRTGKNYGDSNHGERPGMPAHSSPNGTAGKGLFASVNVACRHECNAAMQSRRQMPVAYAAAASYRMP